MAGVLACHLPMAGRSGPPASLSGGHESQTHPDRGQLHRAVAESGPTVGFSVKSTIHPDRAVLPPYPYPYTTQREAALHRLALTRHHPAAATRPSRPHTLRPATAPQPPPYPRVTRVSACAGCPYSLSSSPATLCEPSSPRLKGPQDRTASGKVPPSRQGRTALSTCTVICMYSTRVICNKNKTRPPTGGTRRGITSGKPATLQ